MNFLAGQNCSHNISFAGIGIQPILKNFLEKIDRARQLLAVSERKNKTVQEKDRIQKEITILEESLKLRAECWGPEQIMTLMLVLETSNRTGNKIVIDSLYRKFGLVKTIFRTKYLEISEEDERKIKGK